LSLVGPPGGGGVGALIASGGGGGGGGGCGALLPLGAPGGGGDGVPELGMYGDKILRSLAPAVPPSSCQSGGVALLQARHTICQALFPDEGLW